MSAEAGPPPAVVVDLARYPLDRPDSAGWQRAVDAVRQELLTAGCSVLAGFISPGARPALQREGAQMAPQAYYDVQTVNVYNTEPDPALPAGHPGRVEMQRGNAFVARDQIPAGSVIGRLYIDAAFRRFLAACFRRPVLHELADPLSALVLNVVAPGGEHPWHFDTNEFTVSMLTQAPQSGGTFEYCPGIRSAAAENFGDVRSVLEGRGEHLIRCLDLRPGDLQLFLGRYSLHRVRQVNGPDQRHSAIFAYSDQPGVIGSATRTRQLFGRVSPEHLAAARRVRQDQLLD